MFNVCRLWVQYQPKTNSCVKHRRLFYVQVVGALCLKNMDYKEKDNYQLKPVDLP